MKIISKEEFFNGINFKQKIPYSKICQLMNQNGDFVVKLCDLMNSRSYLQYDRELHCAAAILLSSKALECQLKVDKLATAYLKAVNEGKNFIIDEEHIKKAKIPLQQAELNIIKSIDYNFGSLQMPYQDLYEWHSKLGKLDPNVYEFTRAIIIDFHKTGITLMYKSYYTSLAALILSNYFFSPLNQMVLNSQRIHGNIYEEDQQEYYADEEEKIKGLPPAYMLKLPNWNPEKIKEFLQNKNKEKNQEQDSMQIEQSQEETEFVEWVQSFNSKIKLHKLYGYLKRSHRYIVKLLLRNMLAWRQQLKQFAGRTLIQFIMSNQSLIQDVKKQLMNLKNIIQQEKAYETYNYGRCFCLNDKSFKQFEKCNKVLLDVITKLNEEIGNEYQKIIHCKLEDASNEELIKTEQYLDDLLKQQDNLMQYLQQNIRAMNLS